MWTSHHLNLKIRDGCCRISIQQILTQLFSIYKGGDEAICDHIYVTNYIENLIIFKL